ncbi:hypothetical protein [Azospirillum doebereinerae]|uniref:Uncharacterized protein n=1 Tax=Azospirillum doebereinerae TaxID=92933 RepID=A0A433JB24_9PROT|nr:hypothetical protein [Azospirillum doebereinerae]RUQ73665.1 hypothetical protein EJ913_08355 [Azospirillum doebereinerae]
MLFLRDIDVDVQLRCCSCGHGGALPRALLVRRFGPNYPVLSIAPHYRCSRCDSRDTESRPAPREDVHRDRVTEAPAEPSFDASLAALQGLLASVRGPDKAEEAYRPPPLWSRSNDEVGDKPIGKRPVNDRWDGGKLDDDKPDDDGPDDDEPGLDRTGLDDFPPLPAFKPFVAPEPRPSVTSWADAGAADSDADDDELADTGWDEPDMEPERPAAPAWTPPPVTAKSFRPLEDLAADGPADTDASPLWEPVSLADMAARQEGGAAIADEEDEDQDEDQDEDLLKNDAPLDETLAAMRRFFADADLAGDDEPPAPPVRSAANDTRAAGFAQALDDPKDREEDDEPEDDPAETPVFSYRALVRDDFDEDSTEDDQPEDHDDAEPADADILAFTIRDPEKPAPPPPRLGRAASATPSPADEDVGFDKTLAALRSMIEDAATEPKVVPVRRKTRPAAVPPPEAMDTPEAAVPPLPRVDDPDARTPAKAAKPRRSSQEREIEEAMKALRDLVEDDTPPPQPVLPTRSGGKAKPGPVIRDEVAEEFPPAEPVTPPVGKKRTEADSDTSPLSKTIAALRGMLELDGRRKR